MITEPETGDEVGAERSAEVLGDDDRDGRLVSARRRPWVWALGGVVAASVVWGAVFQSTDRGHTSAPDLHGYRITTGNPCAGDNLKPLTDAMHSRSYAPTSADIRKGPSFDETACTLMVAGPTTHGWSTGYSVAVTIELHKKIDPRVEFEDRNRPEIARLTDNEPGTSMLVISTQVNVKVDAFPGIGDNAFLLDGGSGGQTLNVLYGGAVFSLAINGNNTWDAPGSPPAATTSPHADLTALRPALAPTIRRLMASLST
jgi:hypothetical protein